MPAILPAKHHKIYNMPVGSFPAFSRTSHRGTDWTVRHWHLPIATETLLSIPRQVRNFCGGFRSKLTSATSDVDEILFPHINQAIASPL
jgi:hypothetical protein